MTTRQEALDALRRIEKVTAALKRAADFEIQRGDRALLEALAKALGELTSDEWWDKAPPGGIAHVIRERLERK